MEIYMAISLMVKGYSKLRKINSKVYFKNIYSLDACSYIMHTTFSKVHSINTVWWTSFSCKRCQLDELNKRGRRKWFNDK